MSSIKQTSLVRYAPFSAGAKPDYFSQLLCQRKMQEMASYRCTIGVTPEQEGSFYRESGKFCQAHGGTVTATKLSIAFEV
ncbi:MAG: hypothetical protein E8D52_07985 [Nitrospira sp.]|nr:MAG: hypothetical protein E8D52_07985 [Nitrospira sp.]